MNSDEQELARKGKLIIVEHGRYAIVAIQLPKGSVITLEGGTKEQLLAELCYMIREWPDKKE